MGATMEQLPAAPAVPVQSPALETMSFTGKSGEYFRIWIVNLCLTVITLGIYSPWAKVRRNKYLYRHSHLAGASFDYHADPVAILKGRLIAVSMLGLYLVTSTVLPAVSLLIGLVIVLAVPWLLVRSRMFAMRNTSYRNVRFRFKPIYREAYKVIIGQMLLVIITFGLFYPRFRYARSRLIVDNTAYGTLDLKLGDQVDASEFYGIYLAAGLLFLAVFLLAGVPLMTLGSGGADPDTGVDSSFVWRAFVPTAVLVVLYLLTYYGLEAAVMRLILRGTSVGDHQLRCDWSLVKLTWVQATNLVAIAASLGLLIPWATIRLQDYKLSKLRVAVQGDLGAIAAAEAEEVSALGDEIGDAFDYDFGL